MLFRKVKTPGIAHVAYLIGDEGEAVVVDPRRDIDEYLERSRARTSSRSSTCSRPTARKTSSSARRELARVDRREDRQRSTRALRARRHPARRTAKTSRSRAPPPRAPHARAHAREHLLRGLRRGRAGARAGASSPATRSSSARRGAPTCPIRRRPARTPGLLYDAIHAKLAAARRPGDPLAGARLGLGVRRQHRRARRLDARPRAHLQPGLHRRRATRSSRRRSTSASRARRTSRSWRR